MIKFSKEIIIEAGLYLLVFLLPLQTRLILHQGVINGNPNELLTLSLYGVDILLVLLFISTLILSHRDKIISSINGLMDVKTKILILFLLFSLLSIFWAQNKMLATQRFYWILLACILAWIIVKAENKTKLVFWFLMGLMLSAMLGIWQFVDQYGFASKWLGLAAHNPADGGTSIVEIYSSAGAPIRWLRAYGSFDHPNVFGGAMAVGIIVALWLLTKEIKDKRKNILLYLALASMSAGLFMSLSRSAWAGLILALISIFVFAILKKQKRIFPNMLKPLILMGAVFLLLVFIYPKQFMMRSGGQGRLELKSLDDRGVYMVQCEEIMQENMLLGVGTGNYIEALLHKNPKGDAWIYQPVHNVLLYIWAELGIAGVTLGVTLMALLGIIAWRKDVFFLAVFVSLIPSFFLDHWLWDLHFGILLVGFLAGIISEAKPPIGNLASGVENL